MGVKVAFQDGEPRNTSRAGVVIPATAIREAGSDKAYVFVVADSMVERRAIAIAGERGKDILVTAGLSGGDKVVINAPAGLVSGAKVKEAGL